jgi:hypothetical protein
MTSNNQKNGPRKINLKPKNSQGHIYFFKQFEGERIPR